MNLKFLHILGCIVKPGFLIWVFLHRVGNLIKEKIVILDFPPSILDHIYYYDGNWSNFLNLFNLLCFWTFIAICWNFCYCSYSLPWGRAACGFRHRTNVKLLDYRDIRVFSSWWKLSQNCTLQLFNMDEWHIPFGLTLFTIKDWASVLDASKQFIMQPNEMVSIEIFQFLELASLHCGTLPTEAVASVLPQPPT